MCVYIYIWSCLSSETLIINLSFFLFKHHFLALKANLLLPPPFRFSNTSANKLTDSVGPRTKSKNYLNLVGK